MQIPLGLYVTLYTFTPSLDTDGYQIYGDISSSKLYCKIDRINPSMQLVYWAGSPQRPIDDVKITTNKSLDVNGEHLIIYQDNYYQINNAQDNYNQNNATGYYVYVGKMTNDNIYLGKFGIKVKNGNNTRNKPISNREDKSQIIKKSPYWVD